MSGLQRRQLGRSGIEVTVVGVGCNNFGRVGARQTAETVQAALDNGVNLFDTADIYGEGLSEEYLGRALGGRRADVVIATKVGMSMGSPERRGGSRRWITTAIEDSLRRLGTDYIDLYQHHEPDPETPLEETLETFDELVRSGKVRAIGSSNYSGAQIEDADLLSGQRGWARYDTAQNHYSLLERRQVEEDVTPACQRLDVGILPFFPLASGLLTGKYHRGEAPPEGSRLARNQQRGNELMTDANFDIVEAMERFGRERGVGLLEVAVAGLAARPMVASVIAGATSPEQAAANARAGLWTPSVEDAAEIDRITAGALAR